MVELCETTGRGTEVCAVGLTIARQAKVPEKEIHGFCCTTVARDGMVDAARRPKPGGANIYILG